MMKRCTFSGHRPFYFPWGDNEEDPACIKVKEALAKEIDQAIRDGYCCFITGGAEGVDTWAAEIILDRKKKNPALCLELAKPFAGFNRNTEGAKGERLRAIEAAADKITVVSEGDEKKAAYMLRDCYMVDASSRVIVVYDDASEGSSGTKDTLNYAKACGMDIRQIQWRKLL